MHPQINIERDIHNLDKIFQTLGLNSKDVDIFLSIFAYRYQSSTQSNKLDEYFFFGGSKIIDDVMSAKLATLHHKVSYYRYMSQRNNAWSTSH